MGKASTKAKNKYNDANYDRISLSVPLGKKEEYRKRAEAEGKSLNQYIIDCIERSFRPYDSPTPLPKADKEDQKTKFNHEAIVSQESHKE